MKPTLSSKKAAEYFNVKNSKGNKVKPSEDDIDASEPQ